jgi:sugar lactone lactonase YvrE
MSGKSKIGKISLLLILITVLAALSITTVLADEHVSTLFTFNPAFGELPEGVAVDKVGNVYVSLAPLSKIVKFSPKGEITDFAFLPTPSPFAFGLLGLAVDAPGNVYAGLASGDVNTQGVYKVNSDGTSQRLPGTEAISVPNALAFDKRGNLYVTDTIFGAVWRIPPGGRAELWIQDETLVGFLLPGPGAPPVPLGANGIAYRHGSMYVANTSEAQIVRIPVLKDGSAGTPEIFVKNPAELTPLDGIALDVHGNIYGLVIAQSKLVRIDAQTKEITTLATAADGLDFPASLAFGSGKGNRQSVFVTNFAIGPPGGTGPALLKVEIGVPGLPLP